MKYKIYTSILNKADRSTIDYFIDLYEKCETPEEKEKIALLLGEVTTKENIEKVLTFSISVNLLFFIIKIHLIILK
jgi:hypothetical protein